MKKILILIFSLFNFCCFATYYSQYEQDQYVNDRYFKNKKDGIFIDIGAHKGIEISNSYFFETELNWTGICIEPIPENFEDLVNNRSCVCIQGCISDRPGQAEFIRFPDTQDWFSGLKQKYTEESLQVLYSYGLTSYDVIEVECFLLNDILEKYEIDHIDFLSIDTEGGELDILKSIDFSKYQIDVITVEDNYQGPIAEFLTTKGFILDRRLGADLIFYNKNLRTGIPSRFSR